jgi:GTP-binding protein
MSDWLRSLNVPYVVVGTKADKISRSRRPVHLAAIKKGLQLEAHIPILVYSSETGEGRDTLWELIEEATCDKSLIDEI